MELKSFAIDDVLTLQKVSAHVREGERWVSKRDGQRRAMETFIFI